MDGMDGMEDFESIVGMAGLETRAAALNFTSRIMFDGKTRAYGCFGGGEWGEGCCIFTCICWLVVCMYGSWAPRIT